MRAIVVSVGSELLRGDIVDTNAAFLGRELSEIAVDVRRIAQFPDVLPELQHGIIEARRDAEVTVCTGGLGPTEDDLTRQAIAGALDEQIYVDRHLVDEIANRFKAMGRRMPASNQQQAQLIPSARAISNPNGTAPGWYVERDGRIVVAMPGPPGEMQPMWRDSIRPRLEEMLSEKTSTVALMTFGLGESAVEERIRDVLHWSPDATVATYAKANGVQVHVTARGSTVEKSRALLDEVETRLRDRLGDAVFGTGDATLSSVVGTLALERGLEIGVMESATGGEVASMITNTPGSSAYFRGGIVAYTKEAKIAYGVDGGVITQHGLVSGQTALSMASAACIQFGAGAGIGVTGVAGDEPVEGHPAGTAFVAVAVDGCGAVREIHRPGPRQTVKRFVAQSALDLLRRRLWSEP